ncbi:hypothetical protein ABIA31_006462 [Catenulispora sp. MAP5-51]|uniref:hypothetical protein n=1 Tax=Catenulispora sp. MAP5-51 TaxID=3156298 RepID=UPI0035134F87
MKTYAPRASDLDHGASGAGGAQSACIVSVSSMWPYGGLSDEEMEDPMYIGVGTVVLIILIVLLVMALRRR